LRRDTLTEASWLSGRAVWVYFLKYFAHATQRDSQPKDLFARGHQVVCEFLPFVFGESPPYNKKVDAFVAHHFGCPAIAVAWTMISISCSLSCIALQQEDFHGQRRPAAEDRRDNSFADRPDILCLNKYSQYLKPARFKIALDAN
jgi:hypothetical protein